PAADEGGHRRQPECGPQQVVSEQIRKQRDKRADGEGGQRSARRGQRRGQLVVVDTEFLADVHAQRFLRVGGDLLGHLVGQAAVDPPVPQRGGQFLAPGGGGARQLPSRP